MENIFKSDIKRLKGDGAAIAAFVLLGISFFAMIGFSVMSSLHRLADGFFLYVVIMAGKILLYGMPAISLMLYLKDFYKTKRHTNWFLFLGAIATAAQLTVIALNWGEFVLGFSTDTIHLLFTMSLILLVIQPLVTLVCFLTRLPVAFPRIACLLTVISLALYATLALLSGYWFLVLLSVSYILYSMGLFIAIPAIVTFEREHGHYIHHT